MADTPYRNTSNLQKQCCISRENCNLKSIIEQQSSTIGVLLQEKRDLQEQYEKLLMSIDINSIILISSNIEMEEVDSNIEMNEETSNILL